MRKIISVMVIMFFIVNMFFMLPTIKSAIIGDYYVCNFQQYGNEVKYINETVNNEVWVSIEPDKSQEDLPYGTYNDGSSVRYYVRRSTQPNLDSAIFINFTTYTNNIKLKQYIRSVNSYGASLTVYFYNSNDEQICYAYVTHNADNQANNARQFYVEGSGYIFSETGLSNTSLYFEVTFISGNSSILLQTKNETGVLTNYWANTVTYFDYPIRLYAYTTKYATMYTSNAWIDDLYFNYVNAVSYPWESDVTSYSSYGSVVTSTNDNIVFDYSVIDNWNFEIEKTGFTSYYTYEIKQIALALGYDSDLTNIDIGCFLNSQDVGTYDYTYTYYGTPQRKILVWRNVNLTTLGHNPLIEFYTLKTGGTSPDITLLIKNEDIDNDGDIEFKYSSDNSYLNGIYDGAITENDDLIYKVWYEENVSAYQYGDLSQYDYIGNIYDSTLEEYSMAYKYIEGNYYVSKTLDIVALDLLVHEHQYLLDSDLNNYYAQINGYTIGHPDFWIPFSENWYLLRWIFNESGEIISITNSYPVFEFYHGISDSQGYYWFVACSDESDINLDNNRIRGFHNDPYKYDGFLNGITDIAEFGYRWYYTNEQIDINPSYNDFISTEKDTYYQFEQIWYDGTVSTLVYDNTVHIYKDGSELSVYGFPKDITTYSFSGSFIATDTGSYAVTIERQSNIVAQYNFTVTTMLDPNFWIYTIPNPSNTFTLYTVNYRYNHSENKDGKIVLSTSPNLQATNQYIEQWFINSSTENNSFTHIINYESLFYYIMAVEQSSNVYTPILQYIHVTKDKEYSNELDVKYETLTIYDNEQYATQEIIYQHNHIGSNCIYLTIPSINYKVSLKTMSSGTISVNIYNSGTYTAYLELHTANGTVYLANVSFLVSTESEVTIPETEIISQDYYWLAGIITILIFLLFPMLISAKFMVDIPMVVYIASTLTGVGLAVSFGWLEAYWLLLIVVGMVSATVIMVLTR